MELHRLEEDYNLDNEQEIVDSGIHVENDGTYKYYSIMMLRLFNII